MSADIPNIPSARDNIMTSETKTRPNLYDTSKPSIWEIVSEEFDSRHKKTSLLRGASTPDISVASTGAPRAPPLRMGSHISSKIKQLQLNSQQENRKRHVSESDTSSILESQTSSATFKDARQIVFLEDTEEVINKDSHNNLPVKLIATPVNVIEPVNINFKPVSSQILPVNSEINSKITSNLPETSIIKPVPVTATITPVTTQKLQPVKTNSAIMYSKTNPTPTKSFSPQSPKMPARTFAPVNPPAFYGSPATSPLSPVPSISVGSNSDYESDDMSQEIIYYQRPPEQLHSETIRIRTHSESDQTLELTVTVSQKPASTNDNDAKPSILPPSRRMQFNLDDAPKPSQTPRRSFVFPNFLKLLPSHSDRRNSAPTRSKPAKLADTEDIEILNFKLEAVAINAAYLLARAQDFCGTVDQLGELEDEIERTQRALDDVEVVAPQNMRAQVARATRALNACKMILEERAPSIETLEIGEGRRRSSSVTGGDVRSVSMRVMKLNKEEERRRSSCHDTSDTNRRSSTYD